MCGYHPNVGKLRRSASLLIGSGGRPTICSTRTRLFEGLCVTFPINLKHDHTQRFYQSHAQTYADATSVRALADVLLDFTRRLPGGGRVLDLGRGAGCDLSSIARTGNRGRSWSGKDIAALLNGIAGFLAAGGQLWLYGGTAGRLGQRLYRRLMRRSWPRWIQNSTSFMALTCSFPAPTG